MLHLINYSNLYFIQEKKAERKKRKQEGHAPGIPRTIENTREPDATILDPKTQENEERIEEMNVDIQNDEFQSYFQKQYEPKVLITYSDNPLGVSIIFLLKCSLDFECCYQGQLFYSAITG